MKNPILDILANAKSKVDAIKAAKELPVIPMIKPTIDKPRLSPFREQYLQDVYQSQVQDTLMGNDTAPATVDINNSLNKYIDDTSNLQYSQEKRYQPGYGDCSTYACHLQKQVYGKTVPDTTLGMMNSGTKVTSPRPGDIAIYDTGNGNRHAVTYLGDGMGVQLGNDGVKVKPMNTWKNLIGNYRF
jgi:hypothetical protein